MGFWANTFAMGRVQLQAAMSLLSMDDKENLDPALSSLARCHNTFLSSGDEDGFRWSVHLLQGIIRRTPYKLKSPSELFSTLVSCFDEELAAESPLALAAFHVGRSVMEGGQPGNRWFLECLEHVKTRQLKYEASTCLGIFLQGSEGSLQWFQEARKLSTDKSVASYRVAKALAMVGRHEEASASLASLEGIRDSSFRLALAAMLEAVILRDRRGSGSVSTEDVIRAYSKARIMLLPLMANWEGKLHDYLGCTAPYLPLLIRFLKVDNFTKYLLFFDYTENNLEAFQGPIPEQLEHCLFVLELYKDSRNEMLCIQENGGPVESFMDPRPHLEQGIEILYFSKESSTAVDPLVLGQQVAIKAGHATGFSLASTYIEHYIAYMEQELEIRLRVMLTAFQNNGGQDGEDAEAWAAYYVGTSDVNDGKVSEAHYKCLELAFEKSRTPFLGFHISTALGHATLDLNMKLHYFETMRTYALVLGREEFVLSALYELFNVSLHGLRVFDRAFEIQKEVQCSFPDSMLCQGVSAFMEGSVDLALQSHGGHLAAMQKAVECLEHLPRYDPVKTIPTYFADKDGDVWSSKKNSFTQNVYGNALRYVRDSFLQVPYKVTNEYDAVQTTLGQLDNISSKATLLLEAGSLEEAEDEAANALRVLELWNAKLGPQSQPCRSSILMTLAELVYAHYQRQPENFSTKESAIQMISQFASEAAEVAKLYGCKDLFSFSHGLLLLKLGENSAAITLLEEFPYRILLEDTTCFGILSVGRIKLVDNTKHRFRFMQYLMRDRGDLKKALVWAERERTRDLLFSLKSAGCYRDNYLKQILMFEFDTDYDKAWSEIQTICDMVGSDTVLLVLSVSKHSNGSLIDGFSYLLHSGSEIVGHSFERENLNTLPSVYHLLEAIYTSSGATEELLQTYYNVLITPFSDSLERIQPKRIIFVPSEEYCLLPFAALMDSSRHERPYLIQRYATVTSYSIRLLKECLIREHELARQQLQECHPALLLQANDVPGQQYLDSVLREIVLVQDALKEAGYAINKLVNDQASKEVVLESLPQSSWVHVACHTAEHSDNSNGELVLSRGSLTGNEIQELGSPIEARAVILSACSSGVGRVFAEGVMALSRSFHVMGVPSVLVSLWKIDDEASCILMEKLYENLGKGMDISEALQNGMVTMLDEEDIFGTSAYRIRDWAAFALSGSPYIKL